MNLLLSKGEQVIKEFQYGEKKAKGLFAGKKNNVKRSLIVTNKRIVSQSEGPNTTARKEIPLSAADYVTSSFTKKQRSLVPAIIALVFGLIALIAGLVIKTKNGSGDPIMAMVIVQIGLLVIGGGLLILGIVLLILYFISKTAGVEIVIAGKCLETQLLSVSSSNLQVGKKVKLFKIVVNREVAYPMINELGALLLDLKAGAIGQEE